MSLYEINRRLKDTAQLMEGDSAGSLPGTRSDDFKYQLLGIFNDVLDETGMPAFGLKTRVTAEGAVGEVCYGWSEDDGSGALPRTRGLKLVGHASPIYTAIYAVPLGDPVAAEGVDADETTLEEYPQFVFNADGGDYAVHIKGLVSFVRTNLRPAV